MGKIPGFCGFETLDIPGFWAFRLGFERKIGGFAVGFVKEFEHELLHAPKLWEKDASATWVPRLRHLAPLKGRSL